MKKTNKLMLLATLMAGSLNFTFAQNINEAYNLGSTGNFLNSIKGQAGFNKNQGTGKTISQKVSSTENLSLKVNYTKSADAGSQYLVGAVEGHSGSFLINVDGNKLSGNIILDKEKKAYKYYSDAAGNAFIENTDINKLLCIEYKSVGANAAPAQIPVSSEISAAVADLQSYPGARGCVLLDYDGQYVSGTPWNNGNPINAAGSGMSDADIRESWELISEDYRPFNVNITTNEGVYNSYPKNMRMRVIFTPTNTAAPGAGGVAYISSFRWNDDTPCWVFILSGKAGGEAASHEIGHTFSLGHDGRNNPAEGYFSGHGNWAPIMGVGYYKPISQWSRGEYNSANNTEDDLAKLSGAEMNIGYRNDAAGNNTAAAANLTVDGAGNVNCSGVIETTSDLDYFGFATGGGTVSLNANTVSRHGDLDIEMKLFNSGGGQIGSYNGGDLNGGFSVNLGAGKYYISINGVGAGNPATDGYSDYASIGSYTITGKIPAVVNNNSIATVYKDCNLTGTAIGLEEGSFNLGQLNARGVANDDVSSLKIKSGYEIVLFENDNFTGASITITADNGCLVSNGWNDRATSIIVRTSGVTTLSGTYYLQNQHSNLYMDVNGNNSTDGAAFMQYNFNGGGNQQFEFIHLGGGVYRINAKHSGKSMDVKDVSTTNGAIIHQWSYVGGANQQFIVKAVGDGSYKFISKNSSKVVEVNNWSTVPGEKIQQWDDSNQATSHWKLVPVAAPAVVFQAENFSAMNGIQTETTTDAGGGLNVGYTDANDWIAYNAVNFPTTGNYLIEYRVASIGGGQLSSDLNGGTTVLGTVNIPATGGWQNWTTVSHVIRVNAGTYNFGIFVKTGGWNINWFRISRTAGTVDLMTAVQEVKNETEFLVYPNPASDRLFIKADNTMESTLLIYDSMGREVMNTSYNGEALDVSTLSNGVYSIMLKNTNGVITKRFVKQ